MTILGRIIWISVVSFGAFTLGSPPEPIDLLRSGNAAYSGGDFRAAVGLFERAEDRIHDPGLVAFNKAAALYRLGEYRQAELHYRRCLEDAEGSRSAAALYGLGNCLVTQSRGENRTLLVDAISFYERLLQQTGTDEPLASDARHNLELAKLLLAGARDSRTRQEPSASIEADQNESPNRSGGRSGRESEADEQAGVVGQQQMGAREERQGQRLSQHLPQPGKGNLPSIPDGTDKGGFSADDAREYLKEAADRIASERREHRRQTAPRVPANVKDW
jgi:tetratricopeptide (TPR) repeat protein